MDHLLWHCQSVGGRPPGVRGLGVLQSRLGWPSGRADDNAILQWHTRVRELILADRYS